MNWLMMERWSPYVVGIAIGVLSWFAFLLSNRPLGVSTAFARTAGMIERVFRGERVRDRPYYQRFAPEVGWGWMLMIGIIVGSFISASLSGAWGLRVIPQRWAEAFGTLTSVRLLVAFIGGVLMGIGARWANGCTSGHGISGALQLAVSGWIAAICFFAAGTGAAMLTYVVIAQ